MDTKASPDLLQLWYGPVQREMDVLAAFLRREFESPDPFIWEVLQHIARFRGKQIRPALLFLSSRILPAAGLTGGPSSATRGGASSPADANEADRVKIGAVIELIHTATLVHDDVLDDARLRRNVETVHLRWGERAAVLIGDYIYSRAFYLSTQVEGMASVLSATTNTICEGELLQIGSRFQPDLDEARYLEIIRKKTAILYAVACDLGGRLGGLDARLCARLHELGLLLGMAFQIADDCLDYSGEEQTTGKSLGTDLHQGKLTLPLIYLLEAVPESEKRWLQEVLSGPLSPQAERRIRARIEAEHVLEQAFARAESFIATARAIVGEVCAECSTSQVVRESIESIADYMVRRQR